MRADLETQWRLFADWSASWDRDPLTSTTENIAEFLRTFPATIGTQAKRIRAIRLRYQEVALALELPVVGQPRSSLWHDTDGLLDPRGALAQLPKYRHPVGLLGRRDGFLIVLAGAVGLSRRQIHELRTGDITVMAGKVHIGGWVPPVDEVPASCPRCAVTRWLRILGPVWAGDRATARGLLDVTRATLNDHDCDQPLDGTWAKADYPVLAFDVHGWAHLGGPLSERSITAIVTPSRVETGRVEEVAYRRPTGGRFADSTPAEVYDAQDEFDRKVAAALLRSTHLLDEANDIDKAINQGNQ
jgi:hypothetical protein